MEDLDSAIFRLRGSFCPIGNPKWLNQAILDLVHFPHDGVRPFHQKSTCITKLTLGPCVVRIWSRYPLELRGGAKLCLQTRLMLMTSGWAAMRLMTSGGQLSSTEADAGHAAADA